MTGRFEELDGKHVEEDDLWVVAEVSRFNVPLLRRTGLLLAEARDLAEPDQETRLGSAVTQSKA
jgi:hypothetical protein